MLVRSLIVRSLSICIISIVLATAAGAATMSGFAQQMLAETNLARTNPQRYADNLRELRRQFVGKIYRVPGSITRVATSEGVVAVDDAIRFLDKQSPMPPLLWSQGLSDAAAELVREQAQTGGVGHNGRRSGSMEERIERHGTWYKRIAENIGYGPDTPRLMVMELIIDDGVPGRGHRMNIFNPSLTVAGIACGPHPLFRNMCAMDFAGGFKPR